MSVDKIENRNFIKIIRLIANIIIIKTVQNLSNTGNKSEGIPKTGTTVTDKLGVQLKPLSRPPPPSRPWLPPFFPTWPCCPRPLCHLIPPFNLRLWPFSVHQCDGRPTFNIQHSTVARFHWNWSWIGFGDWTGRDWTPLRPPSLYPSLSLAIVLSLSVVWLGWVLGLGFHRSVVRELGIHWHISWHFICELGQLPMRLPPVQWNWARKVNYMSVPEEVYNKLDFWIFYLIFLGSIKNGKIMFFYKLYIFTISWIHGNIFKCATNKYNKIILEPL